MEIRTVRCTIRDFTSDDISSFMEYRNNMEWMRHQGFKGLPKEVYESELLGSVSLTKGKQFAVVNTAMKTLVGDIYIRQEGEVYWLGYTVSPDYARRGYAAEAVAAVIKWIDGQGGSAVRAGVLPENQASIKLLEKVGFTYLGKEYDELIYGYVLRKCDKQIEFR